MNCFLIFSIDFPPFLMMLLVYLPSYYLRKRLKERLMKSKSCMLYGSSSLICFSFILHLYSSGIIQDFVNLKVVTYYCIWKSMFTLPIVLMKLGTFDIDLSSSPVQLI